MKRPETISIITDFGQADGYVAVMKAVMLNILAGLTFVDISHEIEPQDVVGAAYVLSGAARYFPPGTVHLGVVDPGVGTARRAIAVATESAFFVGPDNGLFGPALAALGAIDREGLILYGGRAVQIANPMYALQPVSDTFHGRDIFAPAAAHIASGVDLSDLGPPIDQLTVVKDIVPEADAGTVRGAIVYIDRFGNAVSNIPGRLIPPRPEITVGNTVVRCVSRNYQENETVAIVGSAGLLEIATKNGSAAVTLGIRRGDEVLIRGRL